MCKSSELQRIYQLPSVLPDVSFSPPKSQRFSQQISNVTFTLLYKQTASKMAASHLRIAGTTGHLGRLL